MPTIRFKVLSTRIGCIVKSNSHVEYVCQAWQEGELHSPPTADEYAFGKLVGIELDGIDSSAAVGVVFDTILHNPDFGNAGPHMMTVADSPVLAPDRLSETAILIGILTLGTIKGPDSSQGVIATTPRIGAEVWALDESQIRAFHDDHSRPAMRYTPHLLAHSSPLVREVLLNLADQVAALFPEDAQSLEIIRSNLAWQIQVQRTQ